MSISISGNGVITGATTSYSFDQSVSIGGTLTYEDVTNIDSVGIITARQGLDTPTDLLLRTGGTEKLRIESDGDVRIGSSSDYGWIRGWSSSTGDMIISADHSATGSNGSNLIFRCRGSEKLRITNAGITSVTGSIAVNGENYPTTGALSSRNMIINGAMNVSQRYIINSGQTATAYRACDRFRLNIGTLGTWTIEQHPNTPPEFSNCFKMTCTVADASPAAGDNAIVMYKVEAQDAQRLAYGTSSAKSMTLSFWVMSNKTGNASFTMLQNDNSNKMVSYQYTINSANTWEYKTITIPGDTSGQIDDNNGEGLQLEWWLNSGSNYQGGSFQNTWTTFNNINRNPSNLAVGGTFDDYYSITGVQLEVGSNATPFEHEGYGQTLIKCQRYFYSPYNASVTGTTADAPLATGTYYTTNQFYGTTHFPTTMRARPTMTASTGGAGEFIIYRNNQANNLTTVVQADESRNASEYYASTSHGANGTINYPGFLRVVGNSAYVFFESEL